MRNGVELVDRDVVIVQTDAKNERQEVDEEEGVEENVGNRVQSTLFDHSHAWEVSAVNGSAEKPTACVAPSR